MASSSSEPTKTVITFITSNLNKVKEVSSIMKDIENMTLTHENIELLEIQGSIEEIAKFKCLQAYEKLKIPVITEDTCLAMNAYQGLPGPYIKWFLQSIGVEGIYRMLSGFEDKSATAICTFAYCDQHLYPNVQLFQGLCQGKIIPPRGETTFGWDPCFQPNGYQQSYAEMDKSLKNSISHRSMALAKLRSFLQSSSQ